MGDEVLVNSCAIPQEPTVTAPSENQNERPSMTILDQAAASSADLTSNRIGLQNNARALLSSFCLHFGNDGSDVSVVDSSQSNANATSYFVPDESTCQHLIDG